MTATRIQKAGLCGINVGISTNWSDYPGGTSGVTVLIGATNGTVFFRLVSP